MSSHFKQWQTEVRAYGVKVASRLQGARLMSQTDIDGLQVVKVECSNCYVWYDELLAVVEAKIISDAKHYCIKCDDNAKLSSGVIFYLPGILTAWHLG